MMTTTTTTISRNSHPETTSTPTILPGSRFQHALHINLEEVEDYPFGGTRLGPGDKTFYNTQDAREAATTAYPIFIERLKAIVEADGKDHPRIDMVRFQPTSTMEPPSLKTWQALDGLHPSHLEVNCGNLEECDLLPLDTFKTQWSLSSLHISSDCLSGFEEGMVPKACNSVTSLVLDTCCNFNYAPPAGTDALRHLTIIENDAIQMFVCIRKNIREVDHLQKLKLVDTRGSLHTYSRDEWRTALKGCTLLKSLDMILDTDTTGYSPERHEIVVEELLEGIDEVLETEWLDDDQDKENVHRNLPAYLPNSLEHLHLQGSPRMVRDLGPWLHHARDPSWLPNLHTISFGLDLAIRKGYGYSAEYEPSAAQREVIAAVGPYAKRFLETFSISHPNVQVLN